MQIRIITLAVILFLSPAQGAPRVLLNIQENTKRQLHYILFAIGNKKKGVLQKSTAHLGISRHA